MLKNQICIALLIATLVLILEGNILVNCSFQFSGCSIPHPERHVVKDLNLKKYIGDWYEVARRGAPFEKGVCAKAQYKFNPQNASEILVKNTEYVNGEKREANLIARVVDENLKGSLQVEIVTDNILAKYFSKASYNVLDTDYEKYALIYSCSHFLGGLVQYESAWVLSRSPQLSEQDFKGLMQKWDQFNIQDFHFTRQYYCSHGSQ